MAEINFVIPVEFNQLQEVSDDYYIEERIEQREIRPKLKEAKQLIKNVGADFILDSFSTFYSVLIYDKLPMDVLFESFTLLHRGVSECKRSFGIIFEGINTMDNDLKIKYRNLLKMLFYIYIKTALTINRKNSSSKTDDVFRKRKKDEVDAVCNLDKKSILLNLNNIINLDIAKLWDPPIVEVTFIDLVADIVYKFLEEPSIKKDKDVLIEVFNLLGTLIESYNHSTSASIRIAQLIKNYEHIYQCLPEGIEQLVRIYRSKGLVHSIIKEITEWQTEERFEDNQATKFCAQFLNEMAIKLPSLMLQEILYLNQYLSHESAVLRNSVLNSITEVIIHVLSKHELTKEETDYRTDFFNILYEHLSDNSVHVRSKVIQNFSKLLEQNAIPRPFINEVFSNVVENHLHDSSSKVRKSAASCVTTFLSHNPYGADLSLDNIRIKYEAKEVELEVLKPKMEAAKLLVTEAVETKWQKLVPTLEKDILEVLQQEDIENLENEEVELTVEEASNRIQNFLNEGKYKEAFQILKKTTNYNDHSNAAENMMEEFIAGLKEVFMKNVVLSHTGNQNVLAENLRITVHDVEKYETLQIEYEFILETVIFLKTLDNAAELMISLLETNSITDMHEAVTFYTAAFKFNLDRANDGIMAMLRIMQRNEIGRRDIIISAFKEIYLTTDAKNIDEHCKIIVDRLINFLHAVPGDNAQDFELIIAEWVLRGILDNNIIKTLWNYYVEKDDKESIASVELLRMASSSRRMIITNNIPVVIATAFGDRGRNNLALLGSSCYLLAVAGMERIDTCSNKTPYRLAQEDSSFTNLQQILFEKFFVPDEFYYHALSGAMEFIYLVCGNPEAICEKLIKDIIEKLIVIKSSSEGNIDRFMCIRICQLLGLVAVKHLNYLDETVYRELKRRTFCRDAKNNKSKKTNQTNNNNSRRLANNKSSATAATNNNSTATNNSIFNGNGENNTGVGDESVMDGAQAEDEDAEFILGVLERRSVTGSGLLANLSNILIEINEKPEIYNDRYIQGAAVNALIRYMLVSTQYCTEHTQLLFTILEKSPFINIKVSILVHLSDLLTRFPNVIEPWVPIIFNRLKDPINEIRQATYFTLSGLILRDMVRAHAHIHLMVDGLVEENKEINSMSHIFFLNLSKKDNDLYNILPDVFAYVMDSQEISDDKGKEIMRYLFELIDKSKQMENLVDRFCNKFPIMDDLNHQRNIAYCLSLITYNDKALRKLQENFDMYKHTVQDPDIYGYFKTILQNATKAQGLKVNNLKPIVEEIEKNIQSIFEMDSNNRRPHSSPPIRSTQKQGRKRGQKRR